MIFKSEKPFRKQKLAIYKHVLKSNFIKKWQNYRIVCCMIFYVVVQFARLFSLTIDGYFMTGP